MLLKELEGLLDQVAQVRRFALGIVNLVTQVPVLGLVEVEDWQELSVVRD